MAYLFFNSDKYFFKSAFNVEEKNDILNRYSGLTEKIIEDSEFKKFEEGLIEVSLDTQNNLVILNKNLTNQTILGENNINLSGPIYGKINDFIGEKNEYLKLLNDYLNNNTNSKWLSFKNSLENLQNPSDNNFPMLKNIVGYMRDLNLESYHISRLP
jgi:hypothetical protein